MIDAPIPVAGCAPRNVDLDLRITIPFGTPMVAVAAALTALATSVNGQWTYRFGYPAQFHIRPTQEVRS